MRGKRKEEEEIHKDAKHVSTCCSNILGATKTAAQGAFEAPHVIYFDPFNKYWKMEMLTSSPNNSCFPS